MLTEIKGTFVGASEELIRKTDNSGLTIARMQQEAYQNSKDHGFHDEPVAFSTRLMLIVSELAEALEEERSGKKIDEIYDGYTLVENGQERTKPEGIPTELADVIIRVGDLAGYYGIDLESAVTQKMKYNAGRPYKHGKAY